MSAQCESVCAGDRDLLRGADQVSSRWCDWWVSGVVSRRCKSCVCVRLQVESKSGPRPQGRLIHKKLLEPRVCVQRTVEAQGVEEV